MSGPLPHALLFGRTVDDINVPMLVDEDGALVISALDLPLAVSEGGTGLEEIGAAGTVFQSEGAAPAWRLSFDFARYGTSGTIAASGPRYLASGSLNATTGTLLLVAVWLVKGMSISAISAWTSITAITGPTNQWMALFDADRNVVAKTADDTTTAWGASTKKTLLVTDGPYVVPSTGLYYIGLLTTSSGSAGSRIAISGLALATNTAPILAGTSTTGLTDPASCTGQQTAISAGTSMVYMELS